MRSRGRVRPAIVGLGLALVSGIVAPGTPLLAQSAPVKLLHHKARSFRIPITVEEQVRPRLREVRLYVSTDSGLAWEMSGRTTPDQPYFTFKARRDAEYWFAVRTVDTAGRPFPPDDRTIEPMLKVVVDTTPPTVVLEPRNRRGSLVSVRWEVKDEYLDLASMTLQYLVEGTNEWVVVKVRDPALIGAESWDAGTAARLTVRATIKDKAGNIGKAEVILPDGIANDPGSAATVSHEEFAPPPILPIASRSPAASSLHPDDDFAEPAAPGPPRRSVADSLYSERSNSAGATRTLLVGSPRFPLQYEVEDAGPNGPALVELWVTQDGGRTWRRMPEDADRVSPYPVSLPGEGTYGLWLVVQGASNLGDPPPAPGDRPQLWVEVDSTPPAVRLDPPRVGLGQSAGKVLITWTATDPHLAPKPVVLSYRADAADSPWRPITGRIDNTGRYIWTVPPNTPPRMHLRIDVIDTLGNRGYAETTDTGPVIVDRARPKGRIIGLDPSARMMGTENRSRQ